MKTSLTSNRKSKHVNNQSAMIKSEIRNKWFLNNYFIIAIILILTSIFYFPSLKNDFINYDDIDFISKNKYIKDLSAEGIKNIFLNLDKHDPITALTHAITYKVWNLYPVPYHAINLLFHLINVLLVFFLIQKIFKNKLISTITALLFALHPLRVESVCWISERKDVLYTMFFLLSIIVYIKYIKKNYELTITNYDLNKDKSDTSINKPINPSTSQPLNKSNDDIRHMTYDLRLYFLSLILFICSLLSKFSAVTLPFVLLLIDYLYKRKIDKKAILEKVPYIILSIFLLIYHFVTFQSVTNPLFDLSTFSFIDKIFLASYSLLYYLIQLIFFYNYSVIHPYPVKINGFLPVEYYVSFGVILIVAAFVFYILKKKKEYNREVIFGLLFFLINISLVLHIVPISGMVIVGDRYSYIAYLGLFFIIALLLQKLSEKNKTSSIITLIILSVFIGECSLVTYSRTKEWKDGITFWTNATDNNPDFFMGYYGKGVAKYNKWDYNASKKEFDKAITLNPNYGLSYLYRARCEVKLKKFDKSIDDYNKAIDLLSNEELAFIYNERGNNLIVMNNFHEAIIDYNLAISMKDDVPTFYNNRGFALLQVKEYKNALKDFNKALQINPMFSEALNNRANTKAMLGDVKGAISDLNYTIELKPNIAGLYLKRAGLYYSLKEYDLVINDCLKGISIDEQNKTLYLLFAIAELNTGNFEDACKQLQIASKLGSHQADSLLVKYCK